MKILHVVPEAAKRIGGIDGFLDGLNAALAAQGGEIVTIEAGRRLAAIPESDIVHFHGLWQPASISIARTLSRLGRRYIVSPHGMLEPWAMRHRFWKKIPYFYLQEAGFLKHASSLLATSDMERNNIRFWVSRSEPVVLPLGIAPGDYPTRARARLNLGWSEKDKILLFLSRVHPKKGLHMLLRALSAEPRLAADGWRLVVVGHGDPAYVGKLRKLEGALPSLPRIEWVGPIWDDRKWDYLSAADYFCLPTYSENFGLAVLESLACGTPVITTTTTPWKLIEDWPGCQIIQPNVAQLRQALGKVVSFEDANMRSELATRALDQFGWNRLVQRYIDFYSGVCDK